MNNRLYQFAEGLVKTTLDIPSRIVRRISFDGNCGLNETVLLASMGRSGSTFVSNIINYNNTFRVMFEPFRFDKVKKASEFVFPMYLRPDNTESRYLDPTRIILSGQVHSHWIDRENKVIFPNGRLIKDIRVNLFLKWIQQHFSEVKIVLLIRHPCAVIESWLSVNFGDGTVARKRLLNNNAFTDDIDPSIIEAYRQADSPFENLVFFWCIFNWVPLKQFEQGLHIVLYEDLVANAATEIQRLFSFLERDYDEHQVLDVLSRPSSTTRNTKYFRSTSDLFKLTKWQDKFSRQQIDRAYEIMNLFGMDTLYDSVSFEPDKESAMRIIENRA